MQAEASKRWTYILSAGLLVGVVVAVYVYAEIHALENQVVGLRFRLDEAQVHLADLSQQSEKHEHQISVIENTTGDTGIDDPSRQQLDALKPGFYVLTTDTQYDPGAEEATTYQITHVTLEMSFDSLRTKLNVGLASSGMIPQSIYFDYDDDGQVDVDMARDFAREIPFIGRRIARAYDPAIAQNLYAIFVAEVDNAEYTSVDDLAQQAEDTSNYLWSFVMDHYQNMEDWIQDHLEEPRADD
jgi:hypothetical protein